MRLAAEPFGDVPTDRVHGIFRLHLRLQVTSEYRPAGQLQRFNTQFVGQLPNGQFREMTRATHGRTECRRDAVRVTETFKGHEERTRQNLRTPGRSKLANSAP